MISHSMFFELNNQTILQIRVPVSETADLINKLCTGQSTWAGAKDTYPEFIGQESNN